MGILSAPPTASSAPPESIRLGLLLEIPRLAGGGLALPELLGEIVRRTAGTLGYETVVAALRRPAWDDFEIAAAHGCPEAETLVGRTVTWAPGEALVDSAGAALVLPMFGENDEVLGVLSLEGRLSDHPPGEDELDLLLAIAAYSGQAIASTRAAVEAASHREALEQLLRVSTQLAGSQEVDEVLQSVCDAIGSALGFGLVVVELADREADRYVPRAASGIDLSHGGIQVDASVAALDALLEPEFEREGCYLLTREEALARVATEPTSFRSTLNGVGAEAWNRHWLLVPLLDREGERTGFIWVDDPADRMIPSRARLQALRTFANHAGTALESAVQFAQLRAADEDRRAVIDASPVGFVALDRDRRVRALNPAAERMFGYTQEQVAGLEPLWIAEDEREDYRRRFDELLTGGGAVEAVYRDHRADGTAIDVHTTSALLRGPEGEVTGILAAIADITAERKATEALRLSEERQRALISSSPVAIIGLDARGLIESWNPAAERIFGWAAEEVLGRRPPFVTDERAHEFEALVERVLGGESLHSLELERVRRDGSRVRTSLSAAPIADANGKISGLISAIADVTELREQEDSLRKTQELYRLVVESSRDLILLLDLEGRIEYASPAQQAILGYADDEIVGMHALALVHPDDVEPVQTSIVSMLKGGAGGAYVARVRHRDGRWVDLEGIPAPVSGDDGRPTGILGFVRDVSDRRRAEDERARLEEELRQAQKLEAIGRLAGGIAHDFNNLLTAIGGYGELALARLPEDSPARGNVEEMRRAGERAAGLTRQLLAFSRRQVLQPKVIDLNGVVTDVRGLLERILGEDVELRTKLAADLGSTKADPGQIEQVIMNLAVNARDAMPRGGSLTIETANVELDGEFGARHLDAEPGSYVLVSVSDTGCGMDRETLERAFEPFFTTKPVGAGTGLGLATVYGIVQQTGGHIWAYSEPGHGSSFKVYLPRVWEQAEVREDAVRAARPGGSETILLVEDEEIVRSLVREMLETSGYRVLEAPHGAAAIALAEEYGESIDALLSDVVMPGLSGQELAARLSEIRPGLRIVFTSGYTEDAIANHGVLSPGTAFLEKPFTAAQLAQKLRDVLDSELAG